jgi:RNA polymerase sigma-70 factor (ECF subfamily)
MQIVLEAPIMQLSGSSQIISELDDIESLVRSYRPRLLRYVAYSVGDPDLAESITQDCLLKAYTSRGSFRGDCSVNTWLFGIANNLIRDQLRSKKFHFWRKAGATAVDITDIASVEPSGERSPEAQLLLRERASRVHLALKYLSNHQRRVFILRFLEEMEVQEISAITGMPANTVKTHLYRAVTAIRKQLGGTQ